MEVTKLQVTLREMAPADLTQVLVIEKAVFTDAWPKDEFEEHMDGSEAGALVAEGDGRLAGYACYQIEDHKLHLTNLAVDDAFRRKSVAKQVLSHILDLARDRDCELIFLEVRISNEAARCFYEASGFRIVDRCRRYYVSPVEDAFIMTRWVDQAPSNR
jgi:[ribosomal protein S18]-alanine N-acetyltransferase